jgi:hypothetical protein
VFALSVGQSGNRDVWRYGGLGVEQAFAPASWARTLKWHAALGVMRLLVSSDTGGVVNSPPVFFDISEFSCSKDGGAGGRRQMPCALLKSVGVDG